MFASTFLKSVAATLLLASVSATPDAGRNDRHPVVTDPPRRTTRPTERTTTTTRETCAKEGADCREDRDCCEKGRYICTATPWEGRGKKQCLKAPPRCYGVNRRCVGAPGKPYVPYAPWYVRGSPTSLNCIPHATSALKDAWISDNLSFCFSVPSPLQL